ncbi:MAG: glycosyltransferase [Bacilli bacterium]|nr:glycosyltransferase [Bacilli bacterium]
MKVLAIINLVITLILAYYLIVTAFVTIAGLLPHKQKYSIKEDKQRFAIFVPCHNEGEVVESTVKNHAQIKYNPALFDVYYIADNCTDNTAEHLRNAIKEVGLTNFQVLERNVDDPMKKGKPHALRWAMEQVEGFYEKYDMFMILDADNFCDDVILQHINSQYLEYKPEKAPALIQAYLDSKNKNSIVANSYYVGYRISNRCAQSSRDMLGLVPSIGGTGFAMTTAFLKEIGGYNCHSLTEDLEIQTIATLHNKKVVYNGNVRVYDEKPTRVKQSIVQRTRWAQGHWWLFFKYTPLLFLGLFDVRHIAFFFKKCDMMFYLSYMFFVFLSVVAFVFSTVCAILKVPFLLPLWANLTILGLDLFYILVPIPVSSLYDGTEEEKKHVARDFFYNLISMLLLSFIQIVAATFGLFKCGNQHVWVKTTHNVTTMEKRD